MAVPVPLAASAVIVVAVRSVMVPPPPAAVATWKKFEKLAPVPAVPLLVIVEEKVAARPAVAVEGVGRAAVRSGWPVKVAETVVGPVTETTQVPVPEQPPPLQPEKMYPAEGVAERVTEVP